MSNRLRAARHVGRPPHVKGAVVRSAQNEPSADWTEPGVFEVCPGVYRIPLPLPTDGLRAVNTYAIEDGATLVLIDPGWAITAARDLLAKALAVLGCGVGDVSRFLVTHIHRDHYTLAVALRREFGIRVSLGVGEQPSLAILADPDRKPFTDHYAQLFRCGAEPVVQQLRDLPADSHDPTIWEQPDDWLHSSQIPLTARQLRVLPTPGHTRGHVVFVDDAGGLLFAGDHVLPHITPSVGFEVAVDELPLGNYLDSLRLVRSQPDRRLLPAHGPVAPSAHARVDELLDHHAGRLDQIHARVDAGAHTAYEVARALSWTRHRRTFAELDAFNQMLAVTETEAHLGLLASQGRLGRADDDGVRHYTPT
ncbi:MAG: MBL fold metallo-hydrolase [Actinobacteria bacterium]|nr:MBL fold metallo-hydrolase [Actinomycetota bacterium]